MRAVAGDGFDEGRDTAEGKTLEEVGRHETDAEVALSDEGLVTAGRESIEDSRADTHQESCATTEATMSMKMCQELLWREAPSRCMLDIRHSNCLFLTSSAVVSLIACNEL